MAGITGLGTTFNLPNFVGELFNTSPEDTPLLSSIGGLTGGRGVNSTVFTWSSFDLRQADATRQRLEGADAPTAEERVRVQGSNVLEIHQEKVSVSYTKQAATGNFKASSTTDPFVGGSNAVQDELAWQLQQAFKQVARDVEKSFIQGTYLLPPDNGQARRTRGLLQAINTNKIDRAGAALNEDAVLDLLETVWTAGGIQESETRTLICGSWVKRQLSTIFITNKNYREMTRNVGGVNLQTIETDFGSCNIMLNRYMPADQLAAVSLEDLTPVFLEIPGKGHFFAEPLAKTGSAENIQLYGEIGLDYGNELKHGRLYGLSVAGS
jgi:hypothetical protein